MTPITLMNIPDDFLQTFREISSVEEQLSAWRKLAGKWGSGISEKEETEELMNRRTRGREVRF